MLASNACAKASIPVLAVNNVGRVIINSGSKIATLGNIARSCIVPFWKVSSFVRTAYGVTSAPVPEIVGIAITGIGETLSGKVDD